MVDHRIVRAAGLIGLALLLQQHGLKVAIVIIAFAPISAAIVVSVRVSKAVAPRAGGNESLLVPAPNMMDQVGLLIVVVVAVVVPIIIAIVVAIRGEQVWYRTANVRGTGCDVVLVIIIGRR
jgi:hypothetical protein